MNINVNEQSVFALVDTEAAATIVSKRLFDTCAAELKTKNRNIRFVGADGTDIPILGVAELHFIVAGCDTIAEAFISENINEMCILGIDFLQKNQCEVNYADMALSTCGGSLPLLKAPKMKNSCDAFLIDSLVLEPLTEIDVPCKVACDELLPRPGCDQQCDAVLERHDGFFEKYEVLTANCIQTVFGNTVCVRLANFTREIRTVPAGTNVARLVPLAGTGYLCYVNAYSIASEKDSILGQRQTTANELINLLKIDSCDLDVVEKETLVRVISEHHNAFSIDDKKQDRTSLVEHSIDTEEALPIRHQPRRMSDEQKRKVDKLIDEMQQTG